MATVEKEAASPAGELVNAVKLAGELAVFPGSSLMVQGKVPQGAAHAILGLLAYRFLGTVAGPVGWVVLAANAYCKSTSGVYLHDYVLGVASNSFRHSKPAEAVAVDTAPVALSAKGSK